MVDDNEVLAHPDAAARELRLDATLAEASGSGPSPESEQRVLAALRQQAALRRRGLWAWAAALLIGGLAVVATVAFGREDDERQTPAQQVEEESPGQDREQDPEVDPEVARTVTRLIRALELPDKRSAALLQLAGIGNDALPLLEKALDEERRRGREEVAMALLAAIQAASTGQAKAKMGWPADQPVILIADYSDNRVAAVGAKGSEIWSMDEIFGVWDAELTAAGTLLLTEFSISRVSEVDKDGKVLWEFGDLKNPYDADRLPNGNTLIADTFGNRVIEVDRTGAIVWKTSAPIRAFDVERLSNGNTLIADVLGDRVIEVAPSGEIAWEVKGMANCHDADRLPNGNTLITLRTMNKVVEVDRDGKTVWELGDLKAPSDADRLPDGSTLVAENGMVRMFDAAGVQIWKKGMSWAVEATRY